MATKSPYFEHITVPAVVPARIFLPKELCEIMPEHLNDCENLNLTSLVTQNIGFPIPSNVVSEMERETSFHMSPKTPVFLYSFFPSIYPLKTIYMLIY